MRPSLSDLATFVAIARHGSFRLASVELGVSPPAVSLALKQLENMLQLKLINRSTRSMSLTEAGKRLYGELQPSLMRIDSAVEDLSELRSDPVGTIRIASARAPARLFLAEIAGRFVARHPGIKIEIDADDNLTDLAENGFDAGVRLGEIVAEHMIALPIGPKIRFMVVATPAYWQNNPPPLSPEDLLQHNCIVFRFPTSRRSYRWAFRRGDAERTIEVGGNLVTNDLDVAMDLALQGRGIAYLLAEQAMPYVRAGSLVPVLDEWLPARPGFHLYYSSARLTTRGFRMFIDFIKADAGQR